LRAIDSDLGSPCQIRRSWSGLRYRIRVHSIEQPKTRRHDRGGNPDVVRLQRLRRDAERPLSVNLAEGIALSHQLMRFTGAARRG
jgi:hypothetical protein